MSETSEVQQQAPTARELYKQEARPMVAAALQKAEPNSTMADSSLVERKLEDNFEKMGASEKSKWEEASLAQTCEECEEFRATHRCEQCFGTNYCPGCCSTTHREIGKTEDFHGCLYEDHSPPIMIKHERILFNVSH